MSEPDQKSEGLVTPRLEEDDECQEPLEVRIVEMPPVDVGTVDKGPSEEELQAQRDERFRQLVKEVLTSETASKLVAAWGRRFEAEPERLKYEHDLRVKAQELNAKAAADHRTAFLLGLCACLLFLGIIVWMLRGEKETLLPVLTAIVGLLAGTGGGFIFGQSQREIK